MAEREPRRPRVPEWLWQGLLLWAVGKALDMAIGAALAQLSAIM